MDIWYGTGEGLKKSKQIKIGTNHQYKSKHPGENELRGYWHHLQLIFLHINI